MKHVSKILQVLDLYKIQLILTKITKLRMFEKKAFPWYFLFFYVIHTYFNTRVIGARDNGFYYADVVTSTAKENT